MSNIPFLPEFRQAILEGRKTMTCRSKAYGKPGDVVHAPGIGLLRLERVGYMILGDVAQHHYEAEGLSSPEEFIAIWNRIHPIKGYDPAAQVVAHRFRLEKAAAPPVVERGRAP